MEAHGRLGWRSSPTRWGLADIREGGKGCGGTMKLSVVVAHREVTRGGGTVEMWVTVLLCYGGKI